jgi:hypothetical protein
LVRGEKGTAQYKATLVGPIFLSGGGPSAISRRTVRFKNFVVDISSAERLVISPDDPRTVRLLQADRPLQNTVAQNNIAVPLVIVSHDLRTVRLLHADRPLHNFCGPKQVAVSLLN